MEKTSIGPTHPNTLIQPLWRKQQVLGPLGPPHLRRPGLDLAAHAGNGGVARGHCLRRGGQVQRAAGQVRRQRHGHGEGHRCRDQVCLPRPTCHFSH